MSLIVLGLYVLAVARVTRLINGDRILDRLRLYPAQKLRTAQMDYAMASAVGQTDSLESARKRVARWDGVVYFVSCPWCVGMWLSLATAVVPVLVLRWPAWALLPVALATSHLVGVCARFADTEEIEIEDGDSGV